MTSETTDSSMGTPSPDAPHPKPQGGSGSSGGDLDAASPLVVPPYSSTSGDELNVLLSQSLTQPKPDPFLGEFSATPKAQEGPKKEPAEGSAFPEPPHESFDAVAPVEAFTNPEPVKVVGGEPPSAIESPLKSSPSDVAALLGTSSAEGWPAASESNAAAIKVPKEEASQTSAFDILAAAAPEPVGPPPQPASFDAFPALDLSVPPSASSTAEPSKKPKQDADEDDDDEYEDDLPSRGSSLLTFLLLSYASAVTIGLLWVLFSGRKLRESDEDVTPQAEASADPGRRADQSRKVAPPPSLASDHLAAFGKALKLGGLEITPVEIVSKPVRLRRALSPKESRDGGGKALWLKLRLRNVTNDTVFAPLDEAFLRERERDVLDSLIQSKDGAQIVMYPLAVSSEWVVDGQEFSELRPGETVEAWVISAVTRTEELPKELTWRVRLRTGIDQTETIGVDFRRNDIRS